MEVKYGFQLEYNKYGCKEVLQILFVKLLFDDALNFFFVVLGLHGNSSARTTGIPIC